MLKALSFDPHFVHTMRILFQDAYVILSLNNSQIEEIRLFRSII